MAFEHMKQILKKNRKQETGPCDRFVAGAIAGVVSQTSIYPFEVSLYLKIYFKFDYILMSLTS